jgi:hypothetical protein
LRLMTGFVEYDSCRPATQGAGMRGSDRISASLFSYVDLEERIPSKHPLRVIKVPGFEVSCGTRILARNPYSRTITSARQSLCGDCEVPQWQAEPAPHIDQRIAKLPDQRIVMVG